MWISFVRKDEKKMGVDKDELLSKLKELLKGEVSTISYDTWFAPLGIDSIKDNDELIKFIKDKNITIPDEIKAYPMDLKKEGNENEKFFDEILNKIKDMHPLYKKYRAKDFFDIKVSNRIKFNNDTNSEIDLIEENQNELTKDNSINFNDNSKNKNKTRTYFLHNKNFNNDFMKTVRKLDYIK